MKVAIIGAGPAGLTAAYQLARSGVDVELLEASPHVGGMCRSFPLWGHTVDLGPHRFFSQDARVNRLWLEVVGRDYRMVDRLTRIYYGGRYFQYPLQTGDALSNLGLWEAGRCVASFMRETFRPTKDTGTFESWVKRRFGSRLFELFFKTYSEKLWGLACHELDSDFAAQRIKKLSLSEAIKNALGIGGRGHRTLVDQFAYPRGGTGMVYERMAEAVDILGSLRCETPVKNLLTRKQDVVGVELHSGEQIACDHVISTMPLTHLVRGLRNVPDTVIDATKALKFRNTVLVYLHVDRQNLFPDQWIYIHAPELKVGRVTNFRNWVPELCRGTRTSVLALEYWCNDGDTAWQSTDAAWVELATNEIRATGLTKSAEILDGKVIRVPKSYPVYARGYKQHVATVMEHLNQYSGLTAIGRYGSFKYNNQDHSILMGLLAAENLLQDHRHDLWSVNTNYEDYQEAGTITEAGLVMSR